MLLDRNPAGHEGLRRRACTRSNVLFDFTGFAGKRIGFMPYPPPDRRNRRNWHLPGGPDLAWSLRRHLPAH
jgi:hypothetical protein